MLHWMRKHMRWILIGIVILVVPTFVLWGGYRKPDRSEREQAELQVVAGVGDVPITAEVYRSRLQEEAQRRAQFGQEVPTMEQMAQDGTAERVLNGIIDSILLDRAAQAKGYAFTREFLIERLKKEPYFQREDGTFDAGAWNLWLDSQTKANWNEVYDNMRGQVARELLLKEVMAPARVLESDIRKQFEDNNTKLQIRAVSIDPAIVPTEEQITAQYDEDPTRYQIPERRKVEFVAVSLTPARPAIMDELVEKIRAGEDFGKLAEAHSQAPDASMGGDMGWVEERENMSENLAALFQTPVGTVSGVVEAAGGFYIYAVDEEKTDEVTGKRSVKARQIMIRPQLEDAEKEARTAQADGVAAKAKETGDLAAAAAEAGLVIQTADDVSVDSTEIEGISRMDSPVFRGDVAALAAGEISNTIQGRQNLYVAKVIEVKEPIPQPLDAVRERVVEDATEAVRRSQERREELLKLGEKIKAEAATIDEVVAKFADQNPEVKTSKEFTMRDWLFSDGIYMQSTDIFAALKDKEIGAFAGPISGFSGQIYFIELVSKSAPTDEDWETKWPEEEKQLRESALSAQQNKLIMDYLALLREKAGSETPVQRNWLAINEVLGLTNPEEAAPAEGATGAEDAAPAPAAEETPAAEAATAEAPATEAPATEAPAAEPPAPAQQ